MQRFPFLYPEESFSIKSRTASETFAFVILPHQGGVTQQLFEGVDPQLAVNVFIVIAQGAFLDGGDSKNLLYTFSGEVIGKNLLFRGG